MRVVGAGLVRNFIAGASIDSAGAAASWLAEARAAEDDHLAASLAAYVQKLQASLALVNSEDAQY